MSKNGSLAIRADVDVAVIGGGCAERGSTAAEPATELAAKPATPAVQVAAAPTRAAPAKAAAAASNDWPNFRGPTGQGHSSETGLPLEWSESRNVVWKAPVPGSGWSSPVVADNRVWLTTAIDTGNPRSGPVRSSLRVMAFDAMTGKEVVNVEVFRLNYAGYINPKNSRAWLVVDPSDGRIPRRTDAAPRRRFSG